LPGVNYRHILILRRPDVVKKLKYPLYRLWFVL
jgi:hypothetical protein